MNLIKPCAYGGSGGGSAGGDGGGGHVATSGVDSLDSGKNSPVVPVGSASIVSKWYVYTNLPLICRYLSRPWGKMVALPDASFATSDARTIG